MVWYKVIFSFMNSDFLDFRIFFADNKKDCIKQFNDYWNNRTGFKIIKIEKR